MRSISLTRNTMNKMGVTHRNYSRRNSRRYKSNNMWNKNTANSLGIPQHLILEEIKDDMQDSLIYNVKTYN